MKLHHRIVYIITFIMSLTLNGTALAAQTQLFTATQVTQIQQIVHDYLIKNPTVLVEASRVLQQQQMAAAQKNAVTAITQNAQEIFNDTGKPVAGNPKGDITLVEYFDYQCPHCKVVGSVVHGLIKANPNLKVIFAEWPIFGANSQFAAKAAIAAMQQHKYIVLHDVLTQKGYPLSKKDVLEAAKFAGLNITKLTADMKAASITKLLKTNWDIARKLKIVGTPAFIIGNPKTAQYRYFDGQTDQASLQKLINQVK